MTQEPTQSGEADVTTILAETRAPTISNMSSESLSNSPTMTQSPNHEPSPTFRTSLGFNRTCTTYKPDQIDREFELIFTYTAESNIDTFDFLDDMEIHLMEHIAVEALDCDFNGSGGITSIAYPSDEAASETSKFLQTRNGKSCPCRFFFPSFSLC